MVHRFPGRHPEGLVIEIGNYVTNNPRPGHAVVAIVSATPIIPERGTNLVQQAPDPLRGTGVNNTTQILQEILIFLRFLRGSLHLSVISRSASLLTIEYCSKKKSMYSHIYTYFFSLSPQPSG